MNFDSCTRHLAVKSFLCLCYMTEIVRLNLPELALNEKILEMMSPVRRKASFKNLH